MADETQNLQAFVWQDIVASFHSNYGSCAQNQVTIAVSQNFISHFIGLAATLWRVCAQFHSHCMHDNHVEIRLFEMCVCYAHESERTFRLPQNTAVFTPQEVLRQTTLLKRQGTSYRRDMSSSVGLLVHNLLSLPSRVIQQEAVDCNGKVAPSVIVSTKHVSPLQWCQRFITTHLLLTAAVSKLCTLLIYTKHASTGKCCFCVKFESALIVGIAQTAAHTWPSNLFGQVSMLGQCTCHGHRTKQ